MKITNIDLPGFKVMLNGENKSSSANRAAKNLTKNKTRCKMGFIFKRSVFMIVVGVVMAVLCSTNAFPFLVANESDGGFVNNGPESTGGSEIRVLVMEAAGAYLKSQSDMLLILNRIEMSEINELNYTELQQIVNNAITNLESSRSKYLQLIDTADITPYDETVLTALKTFSYKSFQVDNRLNEEIFDVVASYLKNGDIRGIYREVLAGTDNILAKLQLIKNAVDSGVFPNVADLWEANKIYMDTLYFGQYASQVFFDVTGK